jgi:hypothetical protein
MFSSFRKIVASAPGKMQISFAGSIFLLVWFFSVLLEPGDLGSSDVGFRLQAAHSLWTSDPQVRADESDWTLPIGRDGLRRIPWGIGQSLIMLPADIVASAANSFLNLPKTLEPKVRQALVGYLTFPPISAAAIVFGMLFLGRLGFSTGQSAIGGLALFFCTSLFPYTQIHQENTCLLLLDVISLYGILSWVRTETSPYLIMVGAALGLSLLIRLTSIFDCIAITAFALLLSSAKGYRLPTIISALGKYVAPFLVISLAIDRLYQFERFGTWADTYVERYAQQISAVQHGLPHNWPWSYPIWDGVYLILFSQERSIFLFDPLLLVTFWIAFRYWKNFSGPVQQFVIVTVLLLGVEVGFYACHDTPVGASTWGSRFTTTPVILISMLAVPMMVERWACLSLLERGLAVIVASFATVVQLCSVIFWYQLEDAQIHDAGSGFVVGMRLLNAVAVSLGEFSHWHLATPSVVVRYLKLNFVPFLIDNYLSASIARRLQFVWSVAVVVALAGAVRLTVLCFRFERQQRRQVPMRPAGGTLPLQ